MDKIPTNQGEKTVPEIMDILMYGSYAANRGYGVSHDRLVNFGIGNDAIRIKYESQLKPKKDETT